MIKVLVLWPIGVHDWYNYSKIIPILKKIFQKNKFQNIFVNFPRFHIDDFFIQKCQNADVLILPLGSVGYDALWAVEKIRSYNISTPVILMSAADFTYENSPFYKKINILNSSDRIVVHSSAEKRLVEMRAPGLKVDIIPIPIEEEGVDFRIVRNYKKYLSIKPNEKIILYIGRINSEKNIHSILFLFSEYRKKNANSRLLLAGPYSDNGSTTFANENRIGYLYELSHLVEKYKLQNCITFLGGQSSDQVRALLELSEMTVSFSLYSGEDFGLSVSEALFYGKPSIISAWGGYTDFLKYPQCEGVGVTVTQNGPKIDYPAALDAMLKFRDKKFSEKNQVFRKNFSQLIIQKKWKNLVKDVARSKSAKRNRIKISTQSKKFSTKDKLYMGIANSYVGLKIKSPRVYVNPMFDIENEYLLDPISGKRKFTLSASEKKELLEIAGKTQFTNLKSVNSKRLLNMGILLLTESNRKFF